SAAAASMARTLTGWSTRGASSTPPPPRAKAKRVLTPPAAPPPLPPPRQPPPGTPRATTLGGRAPRAPAGVPATRTTPSRAAGCTNCAEIGTSTGTTYQDTGLTPNTTYCYRVRAVDVNGKLGPYSNVATAYTGLQMTPRAVALTPGETQQFAATFPGGGGVAVTWSVDGVVGGSSSSGTITPNGLYTAPATAGKHTVTAQSGTQTANADAYTSTLGGVYARAYDNQRSGVNPNETVLSPTNVNSSTFGRLFSVPLDGIAYAS